MKKIILFGLSLFLLTIFIPGCSGGDNVIPPVKPIETTAGQTIAAMNFGWNLGNTLDADSTSDLTSETCWGQIKTTKAVIDGLAASGINTIRIPVSWHNHVTNTGTYKIDDEWMNRVKTIVNWAIEDDMYVILNCHHDNAVYNPTESIKPEEGYYPLAKDKEVSLKFLKSIWAQIAESFKDYDEHLIFETLNEPRIRKNDNGEAPCDHEWSFTETCAVCREVQSCINEYNSEIVKTIRATGSNNKKRLIGIPGSACTPDAVLANGFAVPDDENIAVAVHMYTPYNFAMDKNGSTVFTNADKNELATMFKKLSDKFVQNNIPVYIGEMGAVNKNNLAEREKWFYYYVSEAKKNQIPAIVWDNDGWDSYDGNFEEKFGYYNRKSQTWYFPSLIQNALLAAGTEPGIINQYVSDGNLLSSEPDGTKWGISTSIAARYFANAKVNSKITFQVEPCSDPSIKDSVLQLFDKDWNKLILTGSIDKGMLENENIYLPSQTGTFVYTIKDPDEVKNGLVIQCYGIKLIRVSFTE